MLGRTKGRMSRQDMKVQQIADEGALAVIPAKSNARKAHPARPASLRHPQHRGTLLLPHERHAKALNPLRENRRQLQVHAVFIRSKDVV